MTSEQIASLQPALAKLLAWFRPYFERGKTFRYLVKYILGLLYTDNDPQNPFRCVLASDLFLPDAWANDPQRCQEAGIPEELRHRPQWQIGLEQVRQAIREGIRFSFLTAEEDYGKAPQSWLDLDALGPRAVAEVPKNFLAHETQRLRGEESADHVETGGGGGEHPGWEGLEPPAPLVGLVAAAV